MDASVGASTVDLRIWQLGGLFARAISLSGSHSRWLRASTVPLSWEVSEISLFMKQDKKYNRKRRRILLLKYIVMVIEFL